jgi:hypothetical protein
MLQNISLGNTTSALFKALPYPIQERVVKIGIRALLAYWQVNESIDRARASLKIQDKKLCLIVSTLTPHVAKLIPIHKLPGCLQDHVQKTKLHARLVEAIVLKMAKNVSKAAGKDLSLTEIMVFIPQLWKMAMTEIENKVREHTPEDRAKIRAHLIEVAGNALFRVLLPEGEKEIKEIIGVPIIAGRITDAIRKGVIQLTGTSLNRPGAAYSALRPKF